MQTTAGAQSGQQDNYVFKANAELVLTNVVVRDAKTGEFVRGLKQNDFTISENGKQQQISTFDFQSVEMATPLNEATVSGLAAGVNSPGAKAAVVARPEDLRNHRLIVMFFDLTSMQPEDLDRCVKAARDFLTNKMQPADLVALVSLGDTLKVDQDFTADKAVLANEVGIYNGTEGQGFAQGATANSNQVEDTTGLHAGRERIQRPEYRSRAVRAARNLRSRSRRSRRRSRCCISRAASRATALRTRPRCARRSIRPCARISPSTAWTRAACRRSRRWAMHRPAALAARVRSTGRR